MSRSCETKRSESKPSALDISHRFHHSALSLAERAQRLESDHAPQELQIFAGTWNMHGKMAKAKTLHHFIPPNKYDVYVIGTEECQRSIEKSFVSSSKQKWLKLLSKLFGDEYQVVAESNLIAIHAVVYIRKSLYHLVDNIETAHVGTGLGDTLGNKGGVGISFDIGSTSYAFINCHFAAHQDNVELRNKDFHKINRRLQLRLPHDHDSDDPTMCTDRFDCVVWMGDLNYRVNGTRDMIDVLLEQEMYDVLAANDQLGIEHRAGRVFAGFEEGEVTFMPTYKYDAGKDTYDSSHKQRIPSWTDRVLYKSTRGQLKLLQYDCVDAIKTSDHRPVYALFSTHVEVSRLSVASDPNAPSGSDHLGLMLQSAKCGEQHVSWYNRP